MKRSLSLICAVLLVFSLVSPAYAAQPEGEYIPLGDGYYMIDTVTVLPSSRAGNTVRGTLTRDLYYSSTLIGTATLYAEFDISGSSATAVSAGISGTGSGGWTYDHGNARCSGNSARGTAYFTGPGTTKRMTMTLSCDASGNLS